MGHPAGLSLCPFPLSHFQTNKNHHNGSLLLTAISLSHRGGHALCILQGTPAEGNDPAEYLSTPIPVRFERDLRDFSTQNEGRGKTGTDRQIGSETSLISRPTVLFRRGKNNWNPRMNWDGQLCGRDAACAGEAARWHGWIFRPAKLCRQLPHTQRG